MNNRARDLVLLFIENDHFFTVNELTQHFSVSQRTIYNDLIEIDEFLDKHDLPSLLRQKGNGIKLQLHKLEQKKLKLLLDKEELGFYTPEERRGNALHYLLTHHGYVTIDQISNFLKVSRNTVINDMKQWRLWLQEQELSLVSYPYKGLKIEGTELAIRKALLAVYRENRKRIHITKAEHSILNEFLSLQEIDYLSNMIRMAENELQITISDHSYFRVILHLGLAITRVKQQRVLNKEAISTRILETREYQVACIVKKEIDRVFEITFPENEVMYFASQLVSSSLQGGHQYGTINDQWLPLQMVTRTFIEKLETVFHMSLMEDAQLFNGLMGHLRPAIYRLRNGTPIENPVLNAIKENFQYVHHQVMQAIPIIETQQGVKFNEDEVSFITMYVTAAIERQKKKIRRKPVVIIVCDTGMSTSQMVATQLKNLFHIRVIGAFPARQASEIIQEELIDLVVTTVPIELQGTKIVKVNPVLSKTDIQKLALLLEKFEGQELLVLDILQIIEPYCTIHNSLALQNKLQHYFQHDAAKMPSLERRENPVLIEVLNENLIKTQSEVQDRDSAVKLSGELLLKNNLIERDYIEAMINNVRENGTYIVIAPGIAMPHARPEYGAKNIGFSIVTLKEPIVFGHRTNDPVKIVIGFCAIDHETHLTALSELVSVLNQEEKLTAIVKAETPKEIMDVFQMEEK
ncbi:MULTISPECIES: BglG family transcription antiterminator [Clostridia]|uniref:BglG family transcription antiterminator n=1 Tax=Clostridia TaxID=186801 RepID=UPI000EA1D4E8|nr:MULTISPECIES: BglG family transcription antiterminator [Clostridia]NBJ69233.1 PRD domain-containing protein [Roseburia sp. 1XD42-34]RKI79202.1 PRD domain-containing protein [Clostridium sp. 1xD42-85]